MKVHRGFLSEKTAYLSKGNQPTSNPARLCTASKGQGCGFRWMMDHRNCSERFLFMPEVRAEGYTEPAPSNGYTARPSASRLSWEEGGLIHFYKLVCLGKGRRGLTHPHRHIMDQAAQPHATKQLLAQARPDLELSLRQRQFGFDTFQE